MAEKLPRPEDTGLERALADLGRHLLVDRPRRGFTEAVLRRLTDAAPRTP